MTGQIAPVDRAPCCDRAWDRGEEWCKVHSRAQGDRRARASLNPENRGFGLGNRRNAILTEGECPANQSKRCEAIDAHAAAAQ